MLIAASGEHAPSRTKAVNIASQRELFVDGHLIDQLHGAALKLHRPVMQEVVMVHDQAWEGNTSAYHTIIKDGPI